MVGQRQWQGRPLPAFQSFAVNREKTSEIFRKVREAGRVQIGDAEPREVLEAYRIAIPGSKLCKTAEEAVDFAEQAGCPVVMKIASPDILHKTDIGGVRLNMNSASDGKDSFDLLTFRTMRYMPEAVIWGCLVQRQVRGGKEVIIGVNRDPQFGPGRDSLPQ